ARQMTAPGDTGPPTNTTSGSAARGAHRGSTSATPVALGRLSTTPRAPCSVCSTTSTTVRSKFPSVRAGDATSRRPRSELAITRQRRLLVAFAVFFTAFLAGAFLDLVALVAFLAAFLGAFLAGALLAGAFLDLVALVAFLAGAFLDLVALVAFLAGAFLAAFLGALLAVPVALAVALG